MRFLVLCFLFVFSGFAQEKSPVIADGETPVFISKEFKFTEGPAVDKEGNVYFTDQPNDRIMKYSVDGKLSTFMQPCGRSNGLFFRGDKLIACADADNEMWEIDVKTKEKKVIIKNYKGKRLNAPNDVWVAPNGGLYFSDPFYKRTWWKHKKSEQDTEAVYYQAPGSKEIVRVAANFKRPNGLVGTPDGKHMFITDIGDKKTYKYDIQADGSLTNRRLFCSMGCDGMTLDNQGNLYMAALGVHIFNKEGKKIEHIKIKGWNANVCFGGKDMGTLFITAKESFISVKMKVKGVR
ncbi:MAG: SMP-30/gluconolactonase/LRE family protein [Lentisphaeraceae bacterium]|nr:SMP-30/gluconolactonase/LRE family protein [Lentisphaeraceae bacterium]